VYYSVSSIGRATVFETGGYRFDSYTGYFCSLIRLEYYIANVKIWVQIPSEPLRVKNGNSLIGKILYCDYKDMGSIPFSHLLKFIIPG
jgi:hypothetical protein